MAPTWTHLIRFIAEEDAQNYLLLSQGTSIEKGTFIMTGTGPGIGAMRDPKVVLNHGDDMRVEIEQIGTLVNTVYYE